MTTYTVPAGRYGDYSTAFIQAYIDAKIAGVLDSAPETLDTLNELAAALGDDPAFLTTMASANTTLQTNIDNLSTAAATARTTLQTLLQNAVDAVQADVDSNETASASAVAAEATARGTAITNLQTTIQGLIDAVQADVDANELASDNAEAALSTRLDTLEADPTTATALAAVQADVNQNESDSDSAEAALSARIDTLEADPTTATALAAVQSDVDQNEADADTAIALKANIASPTFTGTPAAPTASAGTNTTQLATTAYVTAAVAALIDSAPGAINTLNELAAALGDDANFSTTITNSIAAVQADVDQNETDSDAAEAALSGRIDTLEADPTTATAVAAKLDASAVSTFGGTLVDDADAAAARTTLGLGNVDNTTDAGKPVSTAAQTALDLKADLAGPALTGAPTVPTASAGTNTTQIASTAFVSTALSNLKGNAPAGLDTLEELATALTNDTAAIQNQTTLINARALINDGTHTGTTGVANVVFSSGLTNAADDTAAASAGVAVNQLYRNGSVVMIRVS